MDVSFVLLRDQEPIARLAALDPDRDWREFVTTTRAWILQTFLRLRAAGVEGVHLCDRLPEEGIAVLSPGDYHAALEFRGTVSRALLVSARGSFRRTPPFADAEIVQNPAQAGDGRRYYLPHWPQPGLMPRDPARSTRIERIAYKGFPKNLQPGFQESDWVRLLASRGIEWVHDSVPYQENRTDARRLDWPDYRDVDLIVAVRPDDPEMYPGRPPTKLINAWLAGVPAILGPELAYRALRRHALDYVEVRDVAETRMAVERLQRDPGLYAAMVERCRERAREFGVDRVVEQWRSVLFERLPDLARHQNVQRWRGRPLWLRQVAGRWRWARTTLPREPSSTTVLPADQLTGVRR